MLDLDWVQCIKNYFRLENYDIKLEIYKLDFIE